MLRKSVNYCLPPILKAAYCRLFFSRNRLQWIGNYNSWDAAQRDSIGYDAPEIFARTVQAAKAVRDGISAYERDSVTFDEPSFDYFLMSIVMTVSALNGKQLNVLDFGGALGSTFWQHKWFLNRLPSITWSVVEQAKFVEIGRREFSDERLKFYESVDDVISICKPNIWLFSSVLQYLRDPYPLLCQACDSSAEAVIVARTPIIEGDDRIAVQRVPSSIYSARYPCRFLSKVKLSRILKNHGQLTPWVPSAIDAPGFYNVATIRGG